MNVSLNTQWGDKVTLTSEPRPDVREFLGEVRALEWDHRTERLKRESEILRASLQATQDRNVALMLGLCR